MEKLQTLIPPTLITPELDLTGSHVYLCSCREIKPGPLSCSPGERVSEGHHHAGAAAEGEPERRACWESTGEWRPHPLLSPRLLTVRTPNQA